VKASASPGRRATRRARRRWRALYLFDGVTLPEFKTLGEVVTDALRYNMKQIRVLRREGHALSQDVVSCVSTLKTANIWAHEELLEDAEWRTIDILSDLPQALAILRGEGFEVGPDSKSTRREVATVRDALSQDARIWTLGLASRRCWHPAHGQCRVPPGARPLKSRARPGREGQGL
jgi:hypothetical protein